MVEQPNALPFIPQQGFKKRWTTRFENYTPLNATRDIV